MSEISVAVLMLAFRLVELTGPDRQRIVINPQEVASLREPRGEVREHFHKDVRCLIFTGDGKFIGVLQTCGEVRKLLEASEGPP